MDRENKGGVRRQADSNDVRKQARHSAKEPHEQKGGREVRARARLGEWTYILRDIGKEAVGDPKCDRGNDRSYRAEEVIEEFVGLEENIKRGGHASLQWMQPLLKVNCTGMRIWFWGNNATQK